MQYQIIDKQGTIIAWINDKTQDIIIRDDYTILKGKDLSSTTIDGELKPVIKNIIKCR